MKYIVTVALALVLAVSGALGLASGPDPTAAEPARVDSADSALIGAQTAEDVSQLVTALEGRVGRLPGDFEAWATLGLGYVEQARVTGDTSYYAEAEDAVEQSFAAGPADNPSAHAAAAALAAARHDFVLALEEAARALAIAPRHVGALAVRIDALAELGRYDAQLRALRTADARQPGIPVASRYSYAFEQRNRLGAASAVLEDQLAGARRTDRAFLLTQLAELDRLRGRLRSAEKRLAQALAESPGYAPARAGRADLAVAQGRLSVAERRFRALVRRAPLPEHLIALGELQLVRGDVSGAARQFDLLRDAVRVQSTNGVAVDLELAQFEADHGSPTSALAMARAEWRLRPTIQAADAMAWALHANGRDEQALRFARKATRLGTPDAHFWLHRGLIEASLGRDAAAVRHLRHATLVDPGFSPWQVAQATEALERLSP